jgi:hypothetical protein
MVGSNLITETDAVKQAGVSARTLHRFSEAGYLTVQVATDGHRLYSETQLQEIFGSFNGPTPTEGASLSEEVESCATTPCGEVKTNFRPSQEETTYYSEATHTPMVEKASPQEKQESTPPSDELQRLKNLVALQERILDMKESEITDLRSQRDWLRLRVEKLEEKGDRDQVLLLSETQALRQLIGLQQKRPSTFRNILEWFGLASSDNVRALAMNEDIASSERTSPAIVVNKAANG